VGVLWPQLSKVLKPVDRGDCINCETWYFFSDPALGAQTFTLLKPVLNWANVCSPEHTSDTSTNYESFLN